jgi:succinate dehydrogenase/fumarate reductase flavoprotein subunit
MWMLNSIDVLQTDVAIVGGGAAATYAALNLHRADVRTVILCKGLVGKSGASIFAGNLVIGGRLLGNSEENARTRPSS